MTPYPHAAVPGSIPRTFTSERYGRVRTAGLQSGRLKSAAAGFAVLALGVGGVACGGDGNGAAGVLARASERLAEVRSGRAAWWTAFRLNTSTDSSFRARYSTTFGRSASARRWGSRGRRRGLWTFGWPRVTASRGGC